MSGAPRQAKRRWGFFLLEIGSVVAGAVVAATVPLRALDDVWRERLLLAAQVGRPPTTVLVVDVSPQVAKSQRCGALVAERLTRGGARAALVLEPLASLCQGVFDPSQQQSELAPPLQRLADGVFRRGLHGQIVGISPGVRDSDLLRTLRVEPRAWIASRAAGAVPVLPLDLSPRAAKSNELLDEKLVVVALRDSSTPDGLSARGVAAVLGTALEDPWRKVAPRWALVLLALCVSAAVAAAQRFGDSRGRARRGTAVAVSLWAGLAAADALGLGWLLPVVSLGLAACVTVVGLALPSRVLEARAAQDAKKVLRDAGRFVGARNSLSDDAQFWQRLARTAAQAHPADDVVIAELPAFSWRLKFWSNGETGEDIIRERRRDIRRTPYCNSQGLPTASIVHDYLVMKATPAVLVPMLAVGEVEGYIMLVGDSAADEFRANPGLSESLARDLAQLVRVRRLEHMEQQSFQGPAGISLMPPSGGRVVLDQARAAMSELRLLGAMVQQAPSGLFYVDSFGDVRIVSKVVARWLPEFGLEVPPQGVNGSVDPGALSLKRLLGGFARQAKVVAPAFTEIGEAGYLLEVPVPLQAARRVKSVQVCVQPLTGATVHGEGFVGTLTESAVRTVSMAPRPSIMAQTAASLQVLSLPQLVESIVDEASHRTDGKVSMQSPRGEPSVVAHRAELEEALVEFLVEAASYAGKDSGPIVTISTNGPRVDLSILDLRLDTPRAALERALRAPSKPPPGLEHFAQWVRAVENSHGEVTLCTEEGWGTVLVASLVRARPRWKESREPGPLTALGKHNRPIQIV